MIQTDLKVFYKQLSARQEQGKGKSDNIISEMAVHV
jgi:hypothetical protein